MEGEDDKMMHLRPYFVTFNAPFASSLRNFLYLCSRYNIKYVFIMARPIKETPVLKGEDAFNFEMRRLEVEHMSKEQRAENRRKLEERIANAKNKIEWCW